MVRTSKTASILRAMAVSCSSSSDDPEADSGSSVQSDVGVSSSVSDDGIQAAQATDTLDEYVVADLETARHGDAARSEEVPRLSDDVEGAADDTLNEEESDTSGTSTSTRSRKRTLMESNVELEYVPSLRPFHKNWKRFEEYLAQYQKDTSTVLVVSETLNVRLRNQHIKKMKTFAGKAESEMPLVPDSMDPYKRVYICTHGWKNRVRSKGVRPTQSVNATECKVRFVAQVVKKADEEWRVQVKLAFYGHNHPVSVDIYESYPKVRQLPASSPVMRDVELMVVSGSKSCRLYDYIRTNSPHRMQMQDVYNLVAKIKKSGSTLSDEDQVAELLLKFSMTADGNVTNVDVNGRGHTAVVSICSQHMRKLYNRFPELLLVDCTHKTNRYNYQLCTFMVMDQFGNGQAVQHSVIERNADWHMLKLIEHFQAVNDWDRTLVIMVDKDLNEIAVLKKMFPKARILLCHFHVIKWLRGAIRLDKKYGTYPSAVLQQLDFCVANMVYARTEEDLQSNAEEFKTLACRVGQTALWEYFETNWMSCVEMWVMMYRMDLPHFRNNTNNRLENFFGKLKVELDSSMNMKQCLEAVISYQLRREDEYIARVSKPGTQRNINYGEEMNQLLGMTSEWLAGVFLTEYNFAVDPDNQRRYTVDDQPLYVTLTRDVRSHRVDKFDWQCTCEFSSTMKLPCRHGMIYRKHHAALLTIPYASIPARWLRVGILDCDLPSIDVPLQIHTEDDHITQKKQMTERNKYKCVQSVFSRLTSELTDLPDAKFTAALDQLENWCDNLRQGNVALPLTQSGTSDSELLPTQVAVSQPESHYEESSVHVAETQRTTADSMSADPKPVANLQKRAMKAARKDTPKINQFNPRAPKLGRPRKNRAAQDAQRNADRREYNKGAKLRNALRADDVVHVEEFLKSSQPSLMELTSYLNTFETRHCGRKERNITVTKRAPPGDCVPYRLPEAMVQKALADIERRTPYGDVMDLSTPMDPSVECWLADIDGVGVFTQRQLMAMQFSWSLSAACANGLKCYSWLMSKVDILFDNDQAALLAKRMIETWPAQRLPGFDQGFHLDWTHLYCARDGCWFNDNLIQAFTTTLSAKYGASTTIFLPQLHTPAKDKGNRIPPLTLSLVAATNTEWVFMPLNVNASHWTCLAVSQLQKIIYCYDSLDKRAYHNLLEELAQELVIRSMTEPYEIIAVHNPIQNDGDNCGLFVCLFFWRRVYKEASRDYSKTGCLRQRWDLLRSVVDFSDSSKNAE